MSLESGLFARWFGVASVVLAPIAIVGAFAIGYATTTWILAAAVIAVILCGVWILFVSLFLWRDPELALPGGWDT